MSVEKKVPAVIEIDESPRVSPRLNGASMVRNLMVQVRAEHRKGGFERVIQTMKMKTQSLADKE